MADTTTFAIADDLSGVVKTEDGFGRFKTKFDAARALEAKLLGEREDINEKIARTRAMIRRLEEDLPEPNYWVWINSRKHRADTEEQCWEIIGKSVFGSLYSVESPKGLDVSQFIPY